jgi:hypothetical protein
MPRSFSLVDSKVQESEYFLDRILTADYDFFGVQCDAVAFTASARSITFALQASLTGVDGFDGWYASKQDQLRRDPLARFFHEFRRVSQHIGDNAVIGGSSKNGLAIYHFGSLPDLSHIPALDVASACKQYFCTLVELVFDCYIKFNPTINAQWRFTQAHFETFGGTIDDAFEELGLARGYGAGSGVSEEAQWRILRKQADGCNVQTQFERWLGKRLPHPDDEG